MRSIYSTEDDLSLSQAKQIMLMQGIQMGIVDYMNEYVQGFAKAQLDYQTGYNLIIASVKIVATIIAIIATKGALGGIEALKQSSAASASDASGSASGSAAGGSSSAAAGTGEAYIGLDGILYNEFGVAVDVAGGIAVDYATETAKEVINTYLEQSLVQMSNRLVQSLSIQQILKIVVPSVGQLSVQGLSEVSLTQVITQSIELSIGLDGSIVGLIGGYLLTDIFGEISNPQLYVLSQELASMQEQLASPTKSARLTPQLAQVFFELRPYGFAGASAQELQKLTPSAVEVVNQDEKERQMAENAQDYAEFIAWLEMVFGLINMTIWEWYEFLNRPWDYSIFDEIREFRLWVEGGISDNYITNEEIKNNRIYQKYLELYRRNKEEFARRLARYDEWTKEAEVYSLRKAMKNYTKQTSRSPCFQSTNKFKGKFITWFQEHYNIPFPLHDEEIREKFYNIYPAFTRILLEHFEIYDSFENVMDDPLDVVEWVEKLTGRFKKYNNSDLKPALYNEPRGGRDLYNIEGAPSSTSFYPYVKIFIREAFRFAYENGMRRRLTPQEVSLIRSLALDKTITTYQKIVRAVQKASKPDEGKTLELVTTPRDFLNFMLQAANNPDLHPSHVRVIIRWVEGAQEYSPQIRRIYLNPHRKLDGWYKSTALTAKNIREMVEQYGFEIVYMTDEQINNELNRVRNDPKRGVNNIRLTVRCTRCHTVQTKSLYSIQTSAHCSYCMPKIYTNEAYALKVLTEILSKQSSSFDSFLRTDLKGNKLPKLQATPLWRNQHVYIKDLIHPLKKGAWILNKHGQWEWNKNYYQYETDTDYIKFFWSVHVDGAIFVKVKLKNSDQFVKQADGTDMVFKFLLERQGEQHQTSWKGFIAWLRLHGENTIADIVEPIGNIEDTLIVRRLTPKQKDILDKEHEKWLKQLQRDRDKVKLFEYHQKDGFYLLVMDHTVKPDQMLQFLCAQITEIVNLHLIETIENIRGEDLVSFEEIRQILEDTLMPYGKYIPWLKQRRVWGDITDYLNKTG